ncbi:phosphoribosylglycinamide formyltransferase-1 [Rhodobium orientis]|uniref:Phosphoribosylglycinamide formyltransferase n=1 Tax=Rhodobium orientis TaxID=34017 RepID=A0A327JQQ3_9HYPH|nr:phosphoribosylglycinamide formyltransferase [Rhodobium orientis]MBB4302197.1 phosphoribosylglycinamide formyltransferase-1 [Rhodobium orientis]MBK5948908.1 phosphoribosylglycinamide formyltransferase [Rhodobium orientis]RAI27906.1 phosphoribosylglycinamide formyltransferase [Rhodobium orientis]
MSDRARVVVLISGRGSNMAALIGAAKDPAYPAEIVAVISNRPNAGGLETARSAGIATDVVDHKDFDSREAFEEKLNAAIDAFRPDVVCLAGFMRLLTAGFAEKWRDRLINIHPSLLPSFKGLDTHLRALAAGVKLHGCSVHFVRPEMDAGPLIAQGAVPVLSSDTEETLAARVLAAEHELYPAALALVASGRTRVVEHRVIVEPEEDGALPPALIWPRGKFSPDGH